MATVLQGTGVVICDARDIFGPLCIKDIHSALQRLDSDERYLAISQVPVNQHGGTKTIGVNYITVPGVCKILATARQRIGWIGRHEIAEANAKIKRFQL